MKKIPAPRPSTAPEKPRSSSSLSCANVTFTRSRYAITYRTSSAGISRVATLRRVRVWTSMRESLPSWCGLKRWPAMRITGVYTAVVEANYDWTFVRIDAGEELSGLGECFTAPGLTGIIRDLAPLLIGEDPRDVDRLWSKLRWGASGA